MDLLTSTDTYILQACVIGALAYTAKSRIVKRLPTKTVVQPDLPLLSTAKNVTKSAIPPTRSILTQLQQTHKQCIIFYGSQTGTAERFAHSFAREAQGRLRLGCFVADLDDYDFNDIVKLSEQHLVVFILSTYGEGEPTDNAIAFHKFINHESAITSLYNFRYSAFGLGSSSYAHYNAMIQRVDQVLTSYNAHRIGSVGLGDDGKGTLDEDFSQWTNTTLPTIAAHFGLAEIPYVYKPAYKITEASLQSIHDQRHVFLGEPNRSHLYNRVQGPYTAQNPLPATMTKARELFKSMDRSCLHLEFDISGTSISYDTGDHLALWPVNSNRAVDIFLEVFDLNTRRDQIIHIEPTEATLKLPVPSRTTYESIVRYYLDISGPVSRQILSKLACYATTDILRDELIRLADEKGHFDVEVLSKQLTLAQVISQICQSCYAHGKVNAPFSLMLELLPKLAPRYYSISSSSLVSRKTISITTVVDRKEDTTAGISFHGVSTSYLSALKSHHDRTFSIPATHTLQTQRQLDRGLTSPTPLIHVRRSKFRPPFNPSTPIIMIGPGTGVAPFRAFIQERAHQHSQGRTIGRTILFYGCRDSTKDFLYKDEWEDIVQNNRLGEGVFDIYTAFSRQEAEPKRYVQDLIGQVERAKELRELVLEMGAIVYVCGNAARMAKDVAKAMGAVLVTEGEGEGDGKDVIDRLKKNGRWCEDVW